MLSQLRLELVERRLRHEPSALDGAESAEVSTVAVQGIEPLEAYFGRFLPQLVLALVVPVAVIACIVRIDATSALVMLLTLPLVPVFMVLIGRHTHRKTQARARALTLLSRRTFSMSSAACRRSVHTTAGPRRRRRSPRRASSIARPR